MPTLSALRAFTDNYIWCYAGGNGGTVVVDPGDAGPVLAAVNDGMRIQAIFITHHHPDHAGGVRELKSRLQVPVYGPDDPRLAGIDRTVGHEDRIELDGFDAFTVWQVPGHTLSHVVYFDSHVLFCGDTLFSLGCGRLFEGSPEQMLASLDLLRSLPDHTRLCCGHEYTENNARFAAAAEPNNPARDVLMRRVMRLRAVDEPSLPSDIGTEKACNPFLRVDDPCILSGLDAYLGDAPKTRLARFTALRAWKDAF